MLSISGSAVNHQRNPQPYPFFVDMYPVSQTRTVPGLHSARVHTVDAWRRGPRTEISLPTCASAAPSRIPNSWASAPAAHTSKADALGHQSSDRAGMGDVISGY